MSILKIQRRLNHRDGIRITKRQSRLSRHFLLDSDREAAMVTYINNMHADFLYRRKLWVLDNYGLRVSNALDNTTDVQVCSLTCRAVHAQTHTHSHTHTHKYVHTHTQDVV